MQRPHRTDGCGVTRITGQHLMAGWTGDPLRILENSSGKIS
ncbi:MAG: hypothetical protein POG24_00055 [Acidocella sp.]|nr:hypothetical protein [Acidocella sp.]